MARQRYHALPALHGRDLAFENASGNCRFCGTTVRAARPSWVLRCQAVTAAFFRQLNELVTRSGLPTHEAENLPLYGAQLSPTPSQSTEDRDARWQAHVDSASDTQWHALWHHAAGVCTMWRRVPKPSISRG
jgi:hypothetical protein